VNVALSPAQRRFVANQLESGRYLDAGEVVRDALRLMEARALVTGDGDIMAIAFIVMMEAVKSAREDLKAIMGEIKAINAAKCEMRALLNQMKRDLSANSSPEAGRSALDFSRGLGSERAYHRVPLPYLDPDATGGVRFQATDMHRGKIASVENLRAIVDDSKGRLDSLSEMGEMESLRLQMAMDRLSKLMSTLSNLMKKSSETAEAILQNLK
jgi:hypothetical protein